MKIPRSLMAGSGAACDAPPPDCIEAYLPVSMLTSAGRRVLRAMREGVGYGVEHGCWPMAEALACWASMSERERVHLLGRALAEHYEGRFASLRMAAATEADPVERERLCTAAAYAEREMVEAMRMRDEIGPGSEG